MAAYKYTQKNGVEAATSYPYTSGTTKKAGTCNYDASKVVFKNTSQVKVSPSGDVKAI